MLIEGSQLLKQGDYLWCVGYWQVLFVWLSFFSALQSKVTNLDLEAQDLLRRWTLKRPLIFERT